MHLQEKATPSKGVKGGVCARGHTHNTEDDLDACAAAAHRRGFTVATREGVTQFHATIEVARAEAPQLGGAVIPAVTSDALEGLAPGNFARHEPTAVETRVQILMRGRRARRYVAARRTVA